MRFLFLLSALVGLLVLAACGASSNIPTPERPPLTVPTIAPAPGFVTATAEPINAAPTATAAPQAGVTAVAPVATEVPAAPVETNSKLVGTYSGILPAADAIGRIVTLDLAVDGNARMTTQFIGKGEPIVETGTWTADGDNAAVVFTTSNGQPQDNRITWTLQGNKLVTTEYDQAQYGSAGLPLTRIGTGDVIETSFGGVSFSFDSALASGAQGKFLAPVPKQEAPAFGGAAPEGIQFLFDNQTPPPDYFSPTTPQVYVYPVEGIKAIDPTLAQGLDSLQTMLADGTVAPGQQIFLFPTIPATQVFHAQTEVIDFVNGTGISFITYYAQDVSPIQPSQVFWTFSGITLDGKYYVSAFWPIASPALPPAQNISGAEYDAFAKNYTEYINNLVKTLDSLPPAAFNPNLALLENMARSINASPLFPSPTPAPVVTAEPTSASAQADATPAPAQANAENIAADFNGVRFSFPKSLAQSAQGVNIAAVPVDTNAPGLGGGAPAHTAFGFNGEKITAEVSPFQPAVRVYPAQAIKDLDPALTREVLALKTLLSAQPPKIQEPIPVFPPFNAQQMFHPQTKYVPFNSGQGVRFVTFYAQDAAPITNDGLFYTFQGLSADGKNYITVFWPLKTNALPDSYQDAQVTDYDAWVKQFETYLAATDKTLSDLPADAFVPNLNELDEMIQSLQVPN